MGRVGRRVVSAWTHPGTRLGFWVHFACMSATTTFSVLWGFPYLVTGLGLSRTVASSVLLTTVVVAALTTIAVGLLTTRRPDVRVPLAIGICVVTIAGWLVVVALPPAVVPRGFVIALVCLMGAGAPTSAVAFALARDYNRPSLVGTATGVVNVGGFAATMATSLLIGLILDVAGSTPNGFRLALLALIGVQGFGTVQVLRWWLRARNFVLAEQSKGRAVPVPVVRHRFDLG
jgi:MFS family permease